MKKLTIALIFSSILLLQTSSCGDSELGGCTIDCGVVGVTTITSTFYRGLSESECIEKAQAKGGPNCKANFCPPTGNANDCYRVFP